MQFPLYWLHAIAAITVTDTILFGGTLKTVRCWQATGSRAMSWETRGHRATATAMGGMKDERNYANPEPGSPMIIQL